MGWLSSAGSVARMVGPVAASYIFSYLGAFWIFTAMLGLMVLAIILTAGCYKKLAYHDGYEQINWDKLNEKIWNDFSFVFFIGSAEQKCPTTTRSPGKIICVSAWKCERVPDTFSCDFIILKQHKQTTDTKVD